MGRQPRATYRDHRHIGRGDMLDTGGDALHRQVIGTGRRSSGLHARATVPVVLCAIIAVGCTDVVALALTSRTSLRDVGLLSGPMPVAVHLLAVASLLIVLASRDRRWSKRVLPAVVLATVAIVSVARYVLRATRTVTDHYPPSFAIWVGAVVFTVVASPLVLRGARRGRRVAAILSVPLTVSSAFLAINQHYGYWPDVAALVGHTSQLSATQLEERLRLAATDGPPGPNAHGVLATIDPPAPVSHFAHRPGSVYLPPSFGTTPAGTLPVVIMLGGTPGSPAAWPQAGSAVATADAYAAAHGGTAPILVFVDHNGTALGDTECVDGPRGNAETYITTDVRQFVLSTFHPATTPDAWAVAGFSEGGTCAVHLALRHPDVFGRFAAMAPDREPMIGSPQRTRQELFGGSAQAMADHDPLVLLARSSYQTTTGWFVTGSKDARHKRSTHRLAAAAQASGMTTHLRVVAGQHNWQFATRAFRDILPALAGELDCPHHGTEPTRGVGTPDGGTPILDMVAHPTPAATAR